LVLADENPALDDLSETRASLTFVGTWTRKKTASKAPGDGLSQRWPHSTASPRAGTETDLAPCVPEVAQGALILLGPLGPGRSHVGADAARAAAHRVGCWQIPDE